MHVNTAMTRTYIYFSIIITIGRCQIFIFEKTDLIGFFKIKPRHPDGLKKQIWVEKPSNGSPGRALCKQLNIMYSSLLQHL